MHKYKFTHLDVFGNQVFLEFKTKKEKDNYIKRFKKQERNTLKNILKNKK